MLVLVDGPRRFKSTNSVATASETPDPESSMEKQENVAETGDTVLEPSEWLDAYGDYLYRYAISRLRDTNAAEEVVQETFLAGIKKLSQFSGEGSQRGWILTILKRKIVDHVRQRARFDRDGAVGTDFDPTEELFDRSGHWKRSVAAWMNAPVDVIESRELWEIVENCLTHLPPGQASAFTLSVMEELDSDQICSELEITTSNLWVRLHRARIGLANCVGARWDHAASPSQQA
jgi:RNA polymerase sigma-70 factor (TIGR02943 family)